MEGKCSERGYKEIYPVKENDNSDDFSYSPDHDSTIAEIDLNSSFGPSNNEVGTARMLFKNPVSSGKIVRQHSPLKSRASFGVSDESFDADQDKYDGYNSPELLTPKNQIISQGHYCPSPQRFVQQYTPSIESNTSNYNPFLSQEIEGDKSSLQDSMSILSSYSTSRYYEDFEELSIIGHGQFGDVFKCRHKLDNCTYAIKKLNLNNARIRSRFVIQEILTMAALSNRSDSSCHIIRYYTSWSENNYLYIQTEYCESQLTEKMDSLVAERDIIRFLKQVLKGLSYLHQNNIVHLDIKPDNILIHDGIYKIGDLGMATLSNGSLFVDEGDQRYQPIEIMEENFCELPSVDIYSLGAMLLEICRKYPLPYEGQEWTELRSGTIPYLASYSQELNDIIRSMMRPDQDKRPKAAQLLKSDIFSKRYKD